MVDRLGHVKNYWIVFLAKYPFISKKNANYQIPLKSSFDAPFYYTSLSASHAKPHHSSVFKTLKYICAMFKMCTGSIFGNVAGFLGGKILKFRRHVFHSFKSTS